MDDEVTAARVRDALAHVGTGLAGVQVGVNAGRVTLSGSVATPALRIRAADIATGVQGVDAVDNRIQVAPAAPAERTMPDSS